MCLKGDGVPQNDQEAVRWWTLGAQKGDSTAQYDLGWCCEKGRGIGQDYAQAAYWYRRSADGGDSDAMCNLGWLYEAGQGVEQSWEKAAEWYLRSAEAGSGRPWATWLGAMTTEKAWSRTTPKPPGGSSVEPSLETYVPCTAWPGTMSMGRA